MTATIYSIVIYIYLELYTTSALRDHPIFVSGSSFWVSLLAISFSGIPAFSSYSQQRQHSFYWLILPEEFNTSSLMVPLTAIQELIFLAAWEFFRNTELCTKYSLNVGRQIHSCCFIRQSFYVSLLSLRITEQWHLHFLLHIQPYIYVTIPLTST